MWLRSRTDACTHAYTQVCASVYTRIYTQEKLVAITKFLAEGGLINLMNMMLTS